jgi:hypothetical protein
MECLVFGVVDSAAEEFRAGRVVFDVEQEGSVDDEFTGFSAEFVDEFNFSG